MNLLAAFIFFTRLPFWRLKEVPAKCFKHVVPYWALTGWLTGGIMVAVLWSTAQVLPYPVAMLMALISRLLVTGALHEDGLADFLDGFGGGTTRERILSIMKDSHIGSYGVIGLILYFLLSWTVLISIPLHLACLILLTGDPWCKFTSSQLINYLPYARKEEESKAKVVYNRMTLPEWIIGFISGSVPFLFLLPTDLWGAGLFPVGILIGLCWLMKRKLKGYTGDCCGAMFLISELSFYLGIVIFMQWK